MGGPNCHPSTNPPEDVFAIQPATVTISAYDSLSFWKHVKTLAINNGNLEMADSIVGPRQPNMGNKQLRSDGMPAAFPVIRGGGQMPDQHSPFNWQVLSGLHKLSAQHGLRSPAVQKMLSFLAAEEMTPFDVKQIARLICSSTQYMMFEIIWR